MMAELIFNSTTSMKKHIDIVTLKAVYKRKQVLHET